MLVIKIKPCKPKDKQHLPVYEIVLIFPWLKKFFSFSKIAESIISMKGLSFNTRGLLSRQIIFKTLNMLYFSINVNET